MGRALGIELVVGQELQLLALHLAATPAIEDAPGFDKDDWPSMADANWAAELHAYYNIKPYCEDDLPVLGEPRTTGGSTMSTCGVY